MVSPDSQAQRARCQAETPLIDLFKFASPALTSPWIEARDMKLKTIDSSKEFIRKIHAGRDLRKGISRNRGLLNVSVIPDVVRDLNKSPVYSKNLILNPFPRKIEDIKRWFPLGQADTTIEFVWTASVLSLFIEELNKFVALRDQFHDNYLVGRFDQASSVLDELEVTFGFSLWSIDARLRLLQRSKGLSAQKQFLESTIGIEGIDPFTAYLSFYLSFSCEENVTTTDIARELDELESANVGASLVDYFTFRMNPLELTRVRDPSECLRTEENSPIIDRFETFIQMSQLELVRGVEGPPHHLKQCFELLKDIADKRCINIGKILAKDPRDISSQAVELKYCDEYTRGNYKNLNDSLRSALSETPGDVSLYELAARSRSHAGVSDTKQVTQSLSELIVSQMQKVFELKEDMVGARFELQRLTILCRGHPLTRLISSFLQPNRVAGAGVVTEEDAIFALNSNLINPWTHEPIAKLTGSDWLAEHFRKAFPNSPSLLLHQTLGMPLDEATARLTEMPIPDGRRHAYRGHCYFRNEELKLAVESYRLAILSEPILGIVGCGSPLFSALFSLRNLPACVDLVVSQYLNNQNTHVLFPLKDLLEAASEYQDGGATFNLDLALTAQIYATHTGATFNGLRSDAFENFLDGLGLERASQIELEETGIDRGRLISFLHKVCTIETLEDSTIFESYEHVENERIKILQRLIEIDQINEEAYSDEIRQLTEAAEVASLLQEFEGSRIYVNERGVMRPVEGELRDAFSRYKQLLAEPSLEYQAEDIRRRIKELIDKSDPTADMSNFHLPATEREGLFRRMYFSLLNSFVLDPHYGLRTYLSTNILHGALEGELRHSLGKRGLLISSEQAQLRKAVEATWVGHLDGLSASEWDILINALARFSKCPTHNDFI